MKTDETKTSDHELEAYDWPQNGPRRMPSLLREDLRVWLDQNA